MEPKKRIFDSILFFQCVGILFFIWVFSPFYQLFGVSVIGEIESAYRSRISLKILDIPGSASESSPLRIGQKVSFMLPPEKSKHKGRNNSFKFGNIIEADLEGNLATEYVDASMTTNVESGEPDSSEKVMIWVSNRVEKVKNPKKYKASSSKKEKRKQRKPKEPSKIWTQEETVKGKILISNLRLYIKEENLRPRDKGLDVIEDEWFEKLKPYSGQVVVTSGITHRASKASGTIEIKNLLKIYPK